MTLLTVDNNEFSPIWKAADASDGARAKVNTSNDFELRNLKTGKTIALVVTTTASEQPQLLIREDPSQANRAQVDFSVASQGSKFTMGGAIEIHAKGTSGGQTAIYIADNSNAGNTQGLTINQEANDDEILSLKSSDVNHGMTTISETDTYALFKKVGAADGGLDLTALRDTGTAALVFRGYAVTDNTAKSTSAVGYVVIDGGKKSGTGKTSIGANGNILCVRNDTTTRFILDGDGDSHQDVGTSWTNFDKHDDVELLTALTVGVSRQDDPIRNSFGEFLEYNRKRLEELKLVTFNEDGHHFVNMSKLTMLLVGAIRQQAERFHQLEEKLCQLESALEQGLPPTRLLA